MKASTTPEPTVFVVDDDPAVRHFLQGLISSVDLRVELFDSAQSFLEGYKPDTPGCLLLDIRMPEMSGLELQRELAARKISLPIVFLTGHGDVQIAVRAMKEGAYDFVEKPFNNELLLDVLQKAVAEGLTAEQSRSEEAEIEKRIALLTKRERQVLDEVVAGATNKGIARHLGISERTVENHRGQMMRKMQAQSLAQLVKILSR